MSVPERPAEKRERQDAAMKTLDGRITTLIERMPVDQLRQLAQMLYDEVGYLAEHLPDERESTKRFACTGNAYHGCSYSTPHQQGCKAIGGDGQLVGAYPNASTCEPDCDESAPEGTWCQCSGFDCPTCWMVDQLLGLLEAHGV